MKCSNCGKEAEFNIAGLCRDCIELIAKDGITVPPILCVCGEQHTDFVLILKHCLENFSRMVQSQVLEDYIRGCEQHSQYD